MLWRSWLLRFIFIARFSDRVIRAFGEGGEKGDEGGKGEEGSLGGDNGVGGKDETGGGTTGFVISILDIIIERI